VIVVLLSLAFALISGGLGFMPEPMTGDWWKVVFGVGFLIGGIDVSVTKIAGARK
jgi:hypothetical protein